MDGLKKQSYHENMKAWILPKTKVDDMIKSTVVQWQKFNGLI